MAAYVPAGFASSTPEILKALTMQPRRRKVLQSFCTHSPAPPAFVIEALRLVDHFHWRNHELTDTEMHLDDISNTPKAWYNAWFDSTDLKNRQRKLYIKE